jgi:prevent-host-death family protein
MEEQDMLIRGSQTEPVDVSELRESLRDTLDRVVHSGKRLVVNRHGNPVAAIVPLGDLQALESRDDDAAQAFASTWEDEPFPEHGLSIDEAIEGLDVRPDTAAVDTLAGSPFANQSAQSGALNRQYLRSLLKDIDGRDPVAAIDIFKKVMLRVIEFDPDGRILNPFSTSVSLTQTPEMSSKNRKRSSGQTAQNAAQPAEAEGTVSMEEIVASIERYGAAVAVAEVEEDTEDTIIFHSEG